jgi:F-type H+-transporting ATPase subunit delta
VRAEIIARNYAATLLELADRNGGAKAMEQFGSALDALASAMASDRRVLEFLTTPRVGRDAKMAAIAHALDGKAPELFIRFARVVVEKRRQGLMGEIAEAYRTLVDERMGRVRVEVEISHAPDEKLQREIRKALEKRTGREVIPTFTVDPELLGGIVVRMGDEILDGSVRSRMAGLRRRLLETELPAHAGA